MTEVVKTIAELALETFGLTYVDIVVDMII